LTPRQIQQQFERLGKSLESNVERAVTNSAKEGRLIARQDSSGRWNRRRRARAGYSYSRFSPNPPPQDLGIINIEAGVFLAAWKVIPAQPYGGDGFVAWVINDSDRVEDLINASGKPWLSRPIDVRVRTRIMPVFQHNVEIAVARSVR
jgi:hypothetical protein